MDSQDNFDDLETKEKIIFTAIKLLSKYSYEELSLSKIAKEVGITKPAIYYHFESKEKLVIEALKTISFKIAIKMINILESNLTLKEIFKNILIKTVDIKSDVFGVENFSNFQFRLFSLYDKIPSLKDNVKQTMLTPFREKFFKRIIEAQNEGELRKDIPPEVIMYELGIFTAGFQMYSPFSLPEEETREQIFEHFWSSISSN
jgi:AcrR family transcriptional regulator